VLARSQAVKKAARQGGKTAARPKKCPAHSGKTFRQAPTFFL